jgi:hypothetical protein
MYVYVHVYVYVYKVYCRVELAWDTANEVVRQIKPPQPAYVSIRQHTSAYASRRPHTRLIQPPQPAYVSIRQHTRADVRIRDRSSRLSLHTSAYVSTREQTSAYAYPTKLLKGSSRLRLFTTHITAHITTASTHITTHITTCRDAHPPPGTSVDHIRTTHMTTQALYYSVLLILLLILLPVLLILQLILLPVEMHNGHQEQA